MTLNRRDFISSSCVTASAIGSLGSLTGCTAKAVVKNDQVAQILGDYLAVGSEHHDLVQSFIEDLRHAANTTEDLEETTRILNGERGLGAAERYVIQEFVRFSNYRMWIRREDQTLGPASLNDEQDL